jgi:mandelate racemase
MSKTTPAVRGVKARAIVAPISRPVKNAFGSIEAAPLVLIDLATDQGVTGRSYIFAYTTAALKPLVHLIEEIGKELAGRAIAPFDLMSAMDARFRLLGWQGLVGMAVSGLDMAFWDGLGKIAGKPLVESLGGSVRPIKAYDSYGAVDPKADERDLRRSLELGFRGIKIKGGLGDAANDERIVKGVRALLGPDIALMIDFNQSLDPAEALRRIARLAPYDLARGRGTGAAGKPARPCRGAKKLVDPDPGRRELVVSARLCRSHRGGRERPHHARSHEGRRSNRLAARCGAG